MSGLELLYAVDKTVSLMALGSTKNRGEVPAVVPDVLTFKSICWIYFEISPCPPQSGHMIPLTTPLPAHVVHWDIFMFDRF